MRAIERVSDEASRLACSSKYCECPFLAASTSALSPALRFGSFMSRVTPSAPLTFTGMPCEKLTTAGVGFAEFVAHCMGGGTACDCWAARAGGGVAPGVEVGCFAATACAYG